MVLHFLEAPHIPFDLMSNRHTFSILGNRVISKMNKTICDVIRVVVTGRETEIGFLVEPDSERVPVCHENPLSDIEFTLLHYQRVLDVFLCNELRFFLFAKIKDFD